MVDASVGRQRGRKAAARRTDKWSLWLDRTGGLLLFLLLFGAVLVILMATIFLDQESRVFVLKIATAGLLSFLPGWLYLEFIRHKGQSLYDEYVLNLFRLHIDEYRNLPAPPQHTSYFALWKAEHDQLGPVSKDNLYRKKFEAVYGKGSVSTLSLIENQRRLRDRTETISPVLFATVLLCIGWVLYLEPELWGRLHLLGDVPLLGRPELPYGALRFGFLGAYSFILLDLIRRYFRDDLKTAAYISAVARVVFTTLVITAASVISPWGTDGNRITAFFIGFFPQIGLQILQAGLAKPLRRLIPSIRPERPLSELEGLNIWYEARLVEEGIEDMQNLVSANLIDLLLRTRLPISRLIDWIDQAFLYLHLPLAREGEPSPRHELRRLGIRTATDLARAWKRLNGDAIFCRRISKALNVAEDEGPSVVKAILETLEGEVNLHHVRKFKEYEWLTRDERRKVAPAAAPAPAPSPAPRPAQAPDATPPPPPPGPAAPGAAPQAAT